MSDAEGIAGVGLLIAAFNDEEAGDQALKAMKEAKRAEQFYFEEAAVIRQDAKGKVHYHETGDMSTGKGAGIGALVGGIVGLFGGPVGVAVGAGAGALVGGAVAHGDAGFSDQSLDQIGVALKPGTSAVVAITSSDFLRAFRDQANEENVHEAVSQLAEGITAQLGAGRDAVMGLVLTEEGLAVQAISADDETVEMLGAAVTAEGIVAGQAVVTEEGAAYQVGVATEEGLVTETAAATADAAAVVDTVTTEEGTYIAGAAVGPDDETDDEAADEAADDESAEEEPAEEAAA